MDFRNKQIKNWVQDIINEDLVCAKNFQLSTVLGNPVEIRAWNIAGLPTDLFSTDNGIIVRLISIILFYYNYNLNTSYKRSEHLHCLFRFRNARRSALMIDPQSQANKWIKNMEMDNSLSVVRFTTPNYTKIIEHAITNGQPVKLCKKLIIIQIT